MADTLQQLFRERSEQDTVAVKYGDRTWTWREHVTEAENLLEFYGDEAIEDGARIAVKLPGYELSRGRGGPRCMTMPLVRDGRGPKDE